MLQCISSDLVFNVSQFHPLHKEKGLLGVFFGIQNIICGKHTQNVALSLRMFYRFLIT